MIIIVGPNTGAYLGAGGGTRVALNMAETLAETQANVMLVAAEGLTLSELDALHGTNLVKHERKGYLKILYFLGNRSPHIPFPIKVRLLAIYLLDRISKGDVDLIVFNDDIPKPPFSDQWPCPTILYAHFPYMARIFFNVSDPSEEHRGISAVKDRIVRICTRGSLFIENRPRATLLANSSITKTFIDRIWGKGTEILFPPVSLPDGILASEKTDLVTVISAIQPNKRIGNILTAFAQTKIGRLSVIGRVYESWYFERLLKMRNDLGLENRVEFIIDANDRMKAQTLFKSKIILSASHFEPFGISVVEGMRAGCIPIVYKSSLSGPWIDICEKGRYCFGYQNNYELASNIEATLSDPLFEDKSKESRIRSLLFDRSQFKEKWLKIIDGIK